MAWKVELSPGADRDLDRLDPQHARRIVKFLSERVARSDNPRSIGEPLAGERLGEFWRYRVGDYRLICKIQDERLVVLVIKLGHRREIYRF